jgi:uncharacterized protein YbaR (Trm112 family)
MPNKPLIEKRLLDVLCCPVCKGDLVLTDLRGKDKKLDGKLTCKKCKKVFPIEQGIPIMLP